MATYFANCNTLNLDVSVNRVSVNRGGPRKKICLTLYIFNFSPNNVVRKGKIFK